MGVEVLQCHRCRAVAPQTHEGGVGRDPVQPGEHRGFGPEVGPVAPGLREGVLECLVDVTRIVEKAGDHAAYAVFMALDQIEEAVELGPGCRRFSAGRRIVHDAACIEGVMQLMGMIRHGTCVGTRRRLGDLCDGELDERHERRVQRHLAGCGRCCRAHERLRATIVDLSILRDRAVADAESVRDRVAERIIDLDDNMSDESVG